VAIDSFRALDDLLGDAVHNRAVKYDVAVRMAAWGATTLLVGEYQRKDVGRRPEFAIGDGIILLTNTPQELTAVRGIEVLKLRGADYLSGGHFFDIGPDGLAFYPRVTASTPSPDGSDPLSARMSTGLPSLDALFVGGVPRSSATLLQGATGTGKTILSLQFLVNGARDGEPGVFFTLEETPGQLRAMAHELGWDLAALETAGRLVLSYASPVEMSTDRFLDQALRRVQAAGARRVVVDSLSAASLGVANGRRFREMVHALTKHFRAAGVTLYMTMEVSELLGSSQLSGHGVSSTADNIILLRYVEIQGRLERALSVLKARGLPHVTELRHFSIGADGGLVGGPFLDMQGVLTGLPQPVAAPGPSRRKRVKRRRT
jgi:circadian clock protein KaiC